MSEDEWSGCEDPMTTLRYLCTQGQLGDRKFRLFAIACVRRIWSLLSEEASRKVVEVLEAYGEGVSSRDELLDAYDAANTVAYEANDFIGVDALETWAACAAASTTWFDALKIEQPGEPRPGLDVFDTPMKAAQAAGKAIARPSPSEGMGHSAEEAESKAQVELVRCIFGNPFHPVALNPACQTPTILALATAAYENRTLPAGTLEPDRLAVLADALEEAGCDNAEIVSHLREPGEHVRGCWVLDLLLGKE
jgi:hypothetical protein